jgi:hypothetical protein
VSIGVKNKGATAQFSNIFENGNYAHPVISSVVGPSASLQTKGTESITLYGTNFGLTTNTDLGLKYHPRRYPYATPYTATGCKVSTAHTKIVCTSVAGVGANLTFVLTVAGQVSNSTQSKGELRISESVILAFVAFESYSMIS